MEQEKSKEIPEQKIDVDSFKNVITAQFLSSYRALCDIIAPIPFNPNVRNIIIQNLDTAYLWVLEGIKNLNFTQQSRVQELENNQENSEIKLQDNNIYDGNDAA
jgi:hypothetical protein